MVDNYVNPSIGHVPLRRLRADHLDGLYDQLAHTGGRHGTGLAPKTIHEVHAIVRSSLDLAVRRQFIETNVAQAANARHKRQTRKVPRSWTAEGLAPSSQRHARNDSTPHCTSPRAPGCAAARSPGSSDAPSTKQTSASRSAAPSRASPASLSRSRSRPAPAAAASTLTTKQWTSGPAGGDDWMFVNPAGRFVNPESISQFFHRVQRSLPDLARIWFHDLRHTHASLLIMDGVPVKVVSERLGHANVAFTMHTYQHLLPGMSPAAARQFAALLAAHSR
jgi:hypothetical protein